LIWANVTTGGLFAPLGKPKPRLPVEPFIIETIPGREARNVPVNTSVLIIFNTALDRATIGNKTVIMMSIRNHRVLGNIYYDTDNYTIIFKPLKDLEYNMRYLVTVTTGIKTEAGIQLKENYSFSFITERMMHIRKVNELKTTILILIISVAITIGIVIHLLILRRRKAKRIREEDEAAERARMKQLADLEKVRIEFPACMHEQLADELEKISIELDEIVEQLPEAKQYANTLWEIYNELAECKKQLSDNGLPTIQKAQYTQITDKLIDIIAELRESWTGIPVAHEFDTRLSSILATLEEVYKTYERKRREEYERREHRKLEETTKVVEKHKPLKEKPASTDTNMRLLEGFVEAKGEDEEEKGAEE
jgi:hypothetical protein